MLENIRSKNKEKGDEGEKIVIRYLKQCGYEILIRNFRCRSGEIDVIFKDNEEIVFAEIKTRSGTNYGFPAESVTVFKKNHILNTARYFLYRYHLWNCNVRFDVIEVYLKKYSKYDINHIKNVFW